MYYKPTFRRIASPYLWGSGRGGLWALIEGFECGAKLWFSDNRYHHGALASAHVAFEMEDLLPCSQQQFTLRHRHRQGGPEQGRLQMRMAVAILPRLLMAVVAAGRDQPGEERRQILLEPRFKLDRADGRGAADIENINGPGFDARRGNRASNLRSDVVHVARPGGVKRKLLLVNHVSMFPRALNP